MSSRTDLGGRRLNGSGVGFVEFFHGVVGGWGIGLNVAAGQGLDVFVGRVGGFLGAGAGEDDLLLQGEILVLPELLIELPEALGVDDPDQALGGGGKGWDVLFGVDIDPADEDAVDALEGTGAGTGAGADAFCGVGAPDVVAGDVVLSLGKDEGDVEGDAGGGQFLERGQSGGGGGDFDHAVVVAGGPFFAQFDITPGALGMDLGANCTSSSSGSSSKLT